MSDQIDETEQLVNYYEVHWRKDPSFCVVGPTLESAMKEFSEFMISTYFDLCATPDNELTNEAIQQREDLREWVSKIGKPLRKAFLE